MYLSDAEENSSLYLVVIDCAPVRAWLRQAGIRPGGAVRKKQKVAPREIMWVAGGDGDILLSPRFASGLLVRASTGILCSLDTLGRGDMFTPYAHLDNSMYKQIKKMTTLSEKTAFTVVKKMNDVELCVNTGRGSFWVDSETAFALWGECNGELVSVASIMVGQNIVLRDNIGEKSVEGLFIPPPKEQHCTLELEKIAQHHTEGQEKVCIESEENGSRVTLPHNTAQKIVVRRCDICWACGLCW